MPDKKQRLRDIIAAKSLLSGNFTLASGKASGYFYDMKKTMFDPEGASLVGELLCDLLSDDTETKAVGGLAMKAVKAVREQGGKVEKIVTIVDRLEGARDNLKKEGLELVSLFTNE